MRIIGEKMETIFKYLIILKIQDTYNLQVIRVSLIMYIFT